MLFINAKDFPKFFWKKILNLLYMKRSALFAVKPGLILLPRKADFFLEKWDCKNDLS